MTLLDLFTGHFTWGSLLSELAPIVVCAVCSFFAGYERGVTAGLEEAHDWIRRSIKVVQ
jgi:hypothetical protein